MSGGATHNRWNDRAPVSVSRAPESAPGSGRFASTACVFSGLDLHGLELPFSDVIVCLGLLIEKRAELLNARFVGVSALVGCSRSQFAACCRTARMSDDSTRRYIPLAVLECQGKEAGILVSSY